MHKSQHHHIGKDLRYSGSANKVACSHNTGSRHDIGSGHAPESSQDVESNPETGSLLDVSDSQDDRSSHDDRHSRRMGSSRDVGFSHRAEVDAPGQTDDSSPNSPLERPATTVAPTPLAVPTQTTSAEVARSHAAQASGVTLSAFGRIVGASPAMRRLYPLCQRLAHIQLPVMIEGETGTGKELLAVSLHEMGPRAQGPFVVLDCASLPPNLVESALFGHEPGSFPGADEPRKGLFEQAHGGTLFLDEIGDLDFDLQAKLLRALERSEVTRLGSTRRIQINVRFISATRRDLAKLVRQGRFRDDLYYRLAVTRIELPALRDREGDVEFLANILWGQLGGLGSVPDDLMARLAAQTWPGNVRELQSAVARHLALGEFALGPAAPRSLTAVENQPSPQARPREATQTVQEHGDGHEQENSPGIPPGDSVEEILNKGLPLPEARRRLVAEFERRYIERVLRQTGGDVTGAAAASGVGSRYFRLLRARIRTGVTLP